MAIVTEQFYIGERLFNRTFSDSGRYIVRDGISYLEACDPEEYNRTYTEGEYFSDDEQNISANEILSILLGGN